MSFKRPDERRTLSTAHDVAHLRGNFPAVHWLFRTVLDFTQAAARLLFSCGGQEIHQSWRRRAFFPGHVACLIVCFRIGFHITR